MAVVYTNQHRPLASSHTGARSPLATHLWYDLAESANVQRLYTSAQPLCQWWSGGMTTTAGTVGEQYAAQWVYLIPEPFTRIIVELGGYQVASGATVWRLYSDSQLYTGEFSGREEYAEVTITSTSHAFTAPAYLTVVPTSMPEDGLRATYLTLTSENLDATASGRLWTLHARPAPDEP